MSETSPDTHAGEQPLICLIDDTSDWHRVTEATVRKHGGFRFEGFHSGNAAMTALHRRSASAWPRIILMDYYLGDTRGDTLTTDLLRLGKTRPLIIGHSTMRHGSEAIVQAAGGGVIVKKHADNNGINPSLLRWLAE